MLRGATFFQVAILIILQVLTLTVKYHRRQSFFALIVKMSGIY